MAGRRKVAAEPFDDVAERFLAAARRGEHDLILVSHVLFGSGRILDRLDELAALGRPERAVGRDRRLSQLHGDRRADRRPRAAQRSSTSAAAINMPWREKGWDFLHCPPGFGPRPPITGWYAEFGDLTAPPGGVGYTSDAMRFMGATFDPSALYRFTRDPPDAARRRADDGEDLGAGRGASCPDSRRARAATVLGRAELLNPLDGGPHARFLAFRSPDAQRWQTRFDGRRCVTDVRGDVLRIGIRPVSRPGRHRSSSLRSRVR